MTDDDGNGDYIVTARPGELLDLIPIVLVPVEVFGENDCCEHGQAADCPSSGYGLCDAVEAWSDCNRAIGHVYRIEDYDNPHRRPGDTFTVYVDAADLGAFTDWARTRFGDH